MTIPTDTVHDATLKCLRTLAALDPDRADFRNQRGFSASDSRRGHQLAALDALDDHELDEGRALVARYSGQLSSTLVRAALPPPPPPPPAPRVSLADALDEWMSLPPVRRAA